MTRGLQSPSSTIQRAWHRIGNRIRKAIQPVPNAYEDAAQTIGGRKTHGDKSDGVYRKARPPATYTQPLPSRSVFKKGANRSRRCQNAKQNQSRRLSPGRRTPKFRPKPIANSPNGRAIFPGEVSFDAQEAHAPAFIW